MISRRRIVSVHDSKIELMHSRSRQLPFFMLSLMVKMTLGKTTLQGMSTLERNSMALMKKMRIVLHLPQNTHKHGYQKMALLTAVLMQSTSCYIFLPI